MAWFMCCRYNLQCLIHKGVFNKCPEKEEWIGRKKEERTKEENTTGMHSAHGQLILKLSYQFLGTHAPQTPVVGWEPHGHLG